MIKLEHKQTGKEWNYSATVWFKRGYDLSHYHVLEWYDVVELFYNNERKQKVSAGKMEKRDADKMIDEHPYLHYWYEDVKNPNDEEESKRIADLLNSEVFVTKNQLRDKSLLDEPLSLKYPKAEAKTPYRVTNLIGVWLMKIFHKTLGSVVLTIIATIGTLVGGLLIIAIVNYCHGKGFTL